jgi:23S rRNA pseudouridine1911/1915/1917 synthase
MKPLDIIFVDNHLLVVNKDGGLLTQPSGTERDNLQDHAKAWIKERFNKPGHVFLEAIHRLDAPVSGIVLFARTSKALSRLNASMRNKETEKVYHAFVERSLPAEEGTLEHYLIHDEFHAKVVSENHPEAKFARLRYRSLERKGNFTLVEIQLETGRYHQIRVQLAHVGCPIVGDKLYGSGAFFPQGGIALHHTHLTIPHPISHEKVIFSCFSTKANFERSLM